jgi:hypothetical protein
MELIADLVDQEEVPVVTVLEPLSDMGVVEGEPDGDDLEGSDLKVPGEDSVTHNVHLDPSISERSDENLSPVVDHIDGPLVVRVSKGQFGILLPCDELIHASFDSVVNIKVVPVI